MVTLNQTYITSHGLVEKGDVYQSKFLKGIEELKKGEEQRRKLEEEINATREDKASLEGELARVKTKNTELSFRRPNTISILSKEIIPL